MLNCFNEMIANCKRMIFVLCEVLISILGGLHFALDVLAADVLSRTGIDTVS